MTRRAFAGGLALLRGAGAATRPRTPAEVTVYPDPATELPVTRLTNPAHASFLASRSTHASPPNGAFLLYSSDRTGTAQAFRMDLKTGESEQLSDAAALVSETLCLTPKGQDVCFFDGAWLCRVGLSNLRSRRLYEIPPGWALERHFAVSPDGRRAAFVERRGTTFRLRLLALGGGHATTVVEAPVPLGGPLFRPRSDSILYRQGERALWLVSLNGRRNVQLKPAPGGVGEFHWSRDGRAFLYLSFPEERRSLNSIREYVPEENADRLVAPTSQFAAFSPNGNGSVFVGASSNKASPHLLLVMRSTRRELTLCEHRASDPSAVAPIFSRDSQQVFFQSDMHGRPAIYGMRVDRLVEKTET
ncbi:MAG: PD40 domain-containing protein [Bryobacterales bacterium]|nr:PD40 domain-containing protein [Bryobacterales bacterium]